MTALSELEDLLDYYNIHLSVVPMDHLVLGYYSHDNNGSFILMNSCITDSITYKCILAEEIGHHLTTIGDILPYGYAHHSNPSTTINKQELKALKWATNFLVPTNDLIKFLKTQSLVSIELISNHFEVTYDFMIQKFYFMAKEKSYWLLNNHRSLILSNLPSIYISNMY